MSFLPKSVLIETINHQNIGKHQAKSDPVIHGALHNLNNLIRILPSRLLALIVKEITKSIFVKISLTCCPQNVWKLTKHETDAQIIYIRVTARRIIRPVIVVLVFNGTMHFCTLTTCNLQRVRRISRQK